MPGTDPGTRRAAAVLFPALLVTSVIAADPVHAQVMDDELFTLLLIDQLSIACRMATTCWPGKARAGSGTTATRRWSRARAST
jgi:hypothetical protein